MKNEKAKAYKMTEKVFLYPGETANWHFLPITKGVGQELKAKYGKLAKGFGSLPVTVMIGETVWDTSIFPDKYSGSYILPVKAKVRKNEDIEAGDKVAFSITLRTL
ncbi:MAG TPA: DUF1905 domain-containing protein [Candidatus Paceibacterota bacterium]|nr:DUF1905 domain-containing protein [Candidatus Paceibacterota bacterium]HMO82660.1 DUF1905 domain-containing protein [Candidatus Paceibacterota bacterium]